MKRKRKQGLCRQCGNTGHYSTTCKANYSLIVKTCRSCNEEQYLTNFSVNQSYCNNCMQKRTEAFREKQKEKNKNKDFKHEEKYCNKCKKIKHCSKFVVNRSTVDGLNPYCKTCTNSSYHASKHNYLNSAKTRGIEWSLTDGQVRELHKSSCYYCGEKDQRLHIRRKDHEQGYTPTNSVRTCGECNKLLKFYKHSEEVMLDKFKQIVRNLKKSNNAERHMG